MILIQSMGGVVAHRWGLRKVAGGPSGGRFLAKMKRARAFDLRQRWAVRQGEAGFVGFKGRSKGGSVGCFRPQGLMRCDLSLHLFARRGRGGL